MAQSELLEIWTLHRPPNNERSVNLKNKESRMDMKKPPSGKGGDKNELIKLKDGDSVTGIVIGDFHTYYATFNGKYYQSAQRGQPGAKFRFRVSFAVKDGANWSLKMLEQGSMLYEALFSLNEEYPLEETIITIKRKGSGATDTEYSPLPSGKIKLTKEEAAYLATLKPLDLRLEDEIETDKFNSI
jgi:hypothetical protein